MQRIKALVVYLIFCTGYIQAQLPNYPKSYFRWPVNLKPAIVANLGELRPNHWHMGLDVRTDSKENERVYAAAEGYIAYIGIRPQSFGRFIIINHPNGLSTLYGHLNDFAPFLEEFATSTQYRTESWAQEIELAAGRFPVAKGSFIAYSGSTGGSQGPHVHFEIRNTATGECLNPLFFGFDLPDKTRPSIVRLAIYDRGKSTYNSSPKFLSLKWTDSGYIIPKTPLLELGYRKFSVGIQAFDRMDGSSNEDGIYSAALTVDDRPIASFVIDSISYEETAYLNAHIDYRFRYNGGVFVQHLSRLPGDRGGVYHGSADGVVELSDTAVHSVVITVRDAAQNSASLRFNVKFRQDATAEAFVPSSSPLFLPSQVNILEKPDFEAYLPETCLYDTVRSFYFRNNSPAANAITAIHQLNDPSIPVQDNLTVRLRTDQRISADLKEKIIIQRSDRSGLSVRKAVLTSRADGDWISAEFGDFGNFRGFIDTQAPNFNQLGTADTIDLSPARRILFTPTDNFAVKSFRAELDGKWLRFTNDKSRNWIYVFDERCPDGVHQLTVKVEDLVGNSTTKSWWFKKYPYTPPKKKKKLSSRKKSIVKSSSSKGKKTAAKKKRKK